MPPRAAEIPLPVRAAILTLQSPPCSKSPIALHTIPGVSTRQIDRIYARAITRGFEPNAELLLILDEHIAMNYVLAGLQNKLKKTNSLWSRSSLGIEISGATVRNILHNAGFRKTKPTRKPGLTQKMRQDRLRWCLEHQDWTLDDWKNVIWSDETSVVLNHRRGSYRIWQRSDEALSGQLSENDGQAIRSSCSGAVSHTTTNALVIAGLLRLLRERRML